MNSYERGAARRVGTGHAHKQLTRVNIRLTEGQDMRVRGILPGTQAAEAGIQVGWTICRYVPVHTSRLARHESRQLTCARMRQP